MHGGFYDGYLLDIQVDPDSNLVTPLEVLTANGAEAQDAVDLVTREEAVHGNDIEQLSIDGAGFNGEMLRTMEDPDGLAVEVIVPPRDFRGRAGFSIRKLHCFPSPSLRAMVSTQV